MAWNHITFWIFTFFLISLTNCEVIESDPPKDSSSAIDAKKEAPYSEVGKETGSVVIASSAEDATEPVTSASTTPEPERSYRCRPYSYCRAALFPYEVSVEGQGWTKTFYCQQGVNPLQHCCLPVTQHFICYNITVKDEGRLSLGDGSQKHETDFSALCRVMLESLNQTMGSYSYVSKDPGGANAVYRHATWTKINAKDSYFIQDLACEYKNDTKEADVTGYVTMTTQSPEEEEEEEEEEDDEDEEEREKKEREREEAESDGGDKGGGGERKKDNEEEEEENNSREREEEEEEEEEEQPKKKKKKGRRN